MYSDRKWVVSYNNTWLITKDDVGTKYLRNTILCCSRLPAAINMIVFSLTDTEHSYLKKGDNCVKKSRVTCPFEISYHFNIQQVSNLLI